MMSNEQTDIGQEEEEDDTEVTLKRNPKTDGPRRATQRTHMRCRETLDSYRLDKKGIWLICRHHVTGILVIEAN